MTANLLLASLLLLLVAVASARQAEPVSAGQKRIAEGESRLLCPSRLRLRYCHRPISNLLRHGRPLNRHCCAVIDDVSESCGYLFRFQHWFIVSRNSCAAHSQPPPAPTPLIKPGKHSPPSAAPTPEVYRHMAPPPAAGFYANLPPAYAPSPAPEHSEHVAVPVTRQQVHRMLVTLRSGAHCRESVKRFEECAVNFAEHHLFNDAISKRCCDAVKDVISVCSPWDWPLVPWLIHSADRCINPSQH